MGGIESKNRYSTIKYRQLRTIFDDIDKATNEHEVQAIYERGLECFFDVRIKHPYKCDGYMECELKNNDNGALSRLMLITEYKYNEDLMKGLDKSKILVQVLFYLKKFENNGRDLPNVILVGDKNEVFVMHSNALKPYLDRDIDWSIAPSNAAEKNMDLVRDINGNETINPFIHTIDKTFDFGSVCNEIKNLTFNVKSDIRITDINMSKAFDYFCSNVLKDKKKLNANEIVHIFMDLMLNPRDAYLHPKKKNILVLSDNTEVSVNSDVFESFFKHYTRENYSITEKQKLTEVADRLIEDTERRRKGEFYTPTIWVNEAHKMISEQFGENWRDEYVVWDCAWGTGNLTRDYKFKELYCSTLNEGDLEIGKKYNVPGTGFNTHGAKFQYDFLNDDVEFFEDLKKLKEDKGYLEEKDFLGSKLYQVAPRLIRSLLEGKKLMFLINPPYGTGANQGTTKGDGKKGISDTKIGILGRDAKIGDASKQLYTQFLYRILLLKNQFNLKNINISIYAKSTYFTGLFYTNFRGIFLNEFKYLNGMLFQASNFADVSGLWGIDFALWGCGVTENKSEFPHILKDVVGGTIVEKGKKIIYNTDGLKSGSDWVKEDIKSMCLKNEDKPQQSSALVIKQKGYGKSVKEALFSYVNEANNVYKNNTNVLLVSSVFSGWGGISVLPINFYRVISNYTARKLIVGKYANWVNDKDEYLVPNELHEGYTLYVNDSVVYSIFNTSNNCSSLRQIDYKDKKWDIKNEFFFMSVEDMKELADEHCNDGVYQDIKEHGEERYVYKLLQDVELSEDAQAVLDKAIELTKESFKYREMFNEDHPEYHINTWDAGWYQIKGVLKEYMPDELKEFNEMYKALGDRMRPLVYELGFLKE